MNSTDGLYKAAFHAYQRGDFEAARRDLTLLLAQRPGDSAGLLLMGVLRGKAEPVLGLALVEQAVALDPADASTWYNLGVVEAERNRLEAALEAYRRAVALDPLHVDALGNGCELLRRLDHFDEALVWADRRLMLGSGDWTSRLNRAVCFYHLRRFDEAEENYARAAELAPDRPIVAWERFSMLLHQKRFAEAWDAFESRFAVGHLNGVFCYPFDAPLWRGESLTGKHIMIHNEQGLGDQLMFACALDEVVEQARRTTVVVAPTLVDLFKASFPKAEVLPTLYGHFAGDHPEPPWLKELTPIDYQAPIGSLMAVLRRTPESFDSPRTYLRPSDAARARWAQFDAGLGLKVGLCWASNPALFRMDSARRAIRKSMPLETMIPLASVGGLDLVSVLNWPIEPVLDAFAGRLQDFSARLASMDDTAALIERLDLVITVDTSVAHLAGAMGKETWVLLHDFPDCRWEMESRTSYWYPNVRLFRQVELGDWGPVTAEVAQALRRRIKDGKRT
ncbi:MAG TPA: tetratricopeptide repeat-containing glycosyltransferase family protein [Caulobacteraceae bacterium]